MERARALSELQRHADGLKTRGAAAAYLFGSTARGEGGPHSDLDIFIDVAPGRKFSLLDLIGIKQFLEDEIGGKVDLTTRAGLHPLLRDAVERDALRIL